MEVCEGENSAVRGKKKETWDFLSLRINCCQMLRMPYITLKLNWEK